MRCVLPIVCIVASFGCAQQQAGSDTRPPAIEPTQPATAGAVPWLPAVRRAHAAADAAGTPAAVDQAIGTLSGAFLQLSTTAETGAIRQDLAGRIAGLHRERSRPEDALLWVGRGLSVDAAPSVFTAHLHLERARAAELLGRPALAETARSEARSINRALADDR